MNEARTEKMLIVARDTLRKDPERALRIYAKIVKRGSGSGWACAHLDVAEHHYGLTRYAEAAEHAQEVLDAAEDRVDPGVRAAAGILWCDAREKLKLEIDEPLLLQSIEVAVSCNKRVWAASGLMQVASRQVGRQDRAQAKHTILRAVALYEEAGAVTPCALALRYLSRIEIEDNDRDAARAHLDRGIAYLQKYPVQAGLVKMWADRLVELRDKILRDEDQGCDTKPMKNGG